VKNALFQYTCFICTYIYVTNNTRIRSRSNDNYDDRHVTLPTADGGNYAPIV